MKLVLHKIDQNFMSVITAPVPVWLVMRITLLTIITKMTDSESHEYSDSDHKEQEFETETEEEPPMEEHTTSETESEKGMSGKR